jgi:uncharacterized protein YdeI (YjbR/CyaY-like superfamily)
MPAFKEHCRFGFWKGKLVAGEDSNDEGMTGPFGQLKSVKDLPSKKEMTAYIKKAMKLNEEGISKVKAKKARPELPVPPELAAPREEQEGARQLRAFSSSHRRDYSEWVGEAKRAENENRASEAAVEWIAEGKGRNWKYER